MISIDEAQARVLEQTWQNEPVRLPVEQSIGLTLAEDVTSDVNSPPHDKSLMDGYALIATDVQERETELVVLEEVTAGSTPTYKVRTGSATRIMTGAPVPPGANAVVMVEQTTLHEGLSSQSENPISVEMAGAAAHRTNLKTLSETVRIHLDCVEPNQNIMRRGTSIRRGEVVLKSNRLLRPVDVGLLSEVGRTEVEVIRPPRVAIMATGSELVPVNQIPGAGAIRNSNGPMLAAMVRTTHSQVTDFGICVDQTEALQSQIQRGLQFDVLILSGGVSAGVLDLVPPVCRQLGVRQVFHKVHLKPGKPLWFGICDTGQQRTVVFGLPGNPIGSLVCFELFVRPALLKMAGRGQKSPQLRRATLARQHHHRGHRPTFFPATAVATNGIDLRVTPVAWQGSADQRSVAEANCLAFFPPGNGLCEAGDAIDILLLDAGPGFGPLHTVPSRE